MITGVIAIPLSSFRQASDSVEKAKADTSGQNAEIAAYDSDHEDLEQGSSSDSRAEGVEESEKDPIPKTGDSALSEPSPVLDSSGKGPRGEYKRFAQGWFSRKRWSSDNGTDKHNQIEPGNGTVSLDKTSVGSESSITKADQPPKSTGTDGASPGKQAQEFTEGHLSSQAVEGIASDLLPKLIRSAIALFGSRNLFFSYEYDITRRLGAQQHVEDDRAFFDIVDQEYFWNRHLLQPLIDAGVDDYILPLMQGFVGQRGFCIPPSPEERPSEAPTNEDPDFRLTIISRRSTRRPGLRYLRRGVDETGNVANSVETEQILSSHNTVIGEKVASYVQYRGSIPLYFSQSPYSLKPMPILHQSDAENDAALKLHFRKLREKYGPVQVALLVNKEGVEAPIGQKYEELVQQQNRAEGNEVNQEVGFEWFDFHKECRGMKFENVNILTRKLAPKVKEMGYFLLAPSQKRRQSGVIRTNCMDCLDRTNVVQAAFGAKVLEAQLNEQGLHIDLETSLNTQWFNSLWADNGDAISRQYASTAALKGDYTRTRKRDYRGALNDLGLTLTRYYNNIFGDFFTQAAIDFMLGNVSSSVFVDFEANMMSKDPAISMSKVRASAVETSSNIVIADQGEKLLGSWALLSPKEPNMVRSLPMEEVIVILTDAALYIVRFDWNIEKVSSFERIILHNIKGLVRGTYVTSPFTPAQMEEQLNIGVVIRYQKDGNNAQRTMSRSLSTTLSKQEDDTKQKEGMPPTSWVPNLGVGRLLGRNSSSALSIVALKAMSPSESFLRVQGGEAENVPEQEQVESVSSTILSALFEDQGEEAKGFVEEHPIISSLEAKKSTGYIDYWGHSLKRFVWA